MLTSQLGAAAQLGAMEPGAVGATSPTQGPASLILHAGSVSPSERTGLVSPSEKAGADAS